MENNSSQSQYSGSYKGLLGRVVLLLLISFGSVGIAVPWAIALVYRWFISNVKIDERQLVYKGVGKTLFPSWILVWLVSAGTVGILAFVGWRSFGDYGHFESHSFAAPFFFMVVLAVVIFVALGAWFHLKATKILIHDTHFEGEEEKNSSFGASYLQFIGKHIVFGLRLLVTLGIGLSWALDYLVSWAMGQTKIDDTPLKYTAGSSFLKKWLPYWALLVAIWIAQWITEEYDYSHTANAVNGILQLADLFVQVWVHTVIYRWIFARISGDNPSAAD